MRSGALLVCAAASVGAAGTGDNKQQIMDAAATANSVLGYAPIIPGWGGGGSPGGGGGGDPYGGYHPGGGGGNDPYGRWTPPPTSVPTPQPSPPPTNAPVPTGSPTPAPTTVEQLCAALNSKPDACEASDQCDVCYVSFVGSSSSYSEIDCPISSCKPKGNRDGCVASTATDCSVLTPEDCIKTDGCGLLNWMSSSVFKPRCVAGTKQGPFAPFTLLKNECSGNSCDVDEIQTSALYPVRVKARNTGIRYDIEDSHNGQTTSSSGYYMEYSIDGPECPTNGWTTDLWLSNRGTGQAPMAAWFEKYFPTNLPHDDYNAKYSMTLNQCNKEARAGNGVDSESNKCTCNVQSGVYYDTKWNGGACQLAAIMVSPEKLPNPKTNESYLALQPVCDSTPNADFREVYTAWCCNQANTAGYYDDGSCKCNPPPSSLLEGTTESRRSRLGAGADTRALLGARSMVDGEASSVALLGAAKGSSSANKTPPPTPITPTSGSGPSGSPSASPPPAASKANMALIQTSAYVPGFAKLTGGSIQLGCHALCSSEEKCTSHGTCVGFDNEGIAKCECSGDWAGASCNTNTELICSECQDKLGCNWNEKDSSCTCGTSKSSFDCSKSCSEKSLAACSNPEATCDCATCGQKCRATGTTDPYKNAGHPYDSCEGQCKQSNTCYKWSGTEMNKWSGKDPFTGKTCPAS